jgi:tetratricopeptide (TPR) repeat protein
VKKNPVVPLFLLAALAVGGAPSVAAQPAGSDSAQVQADAFLEKARPALDAGALREAADLLTLALQIAPGYSEALYLRARLELADRSTTLEAVRDMQGALANGSWTVTNPAVVQQALSEVFLRTGRFADARTILVKLAAHDPENTRTPFLLARVLAGQGDTMALRGVLSDSRAKFPLDDDLALLSAGLLEKGGRRSAARQLIARQLEVHPASLGLLLRAAELQPTPNERVAAVDRYAQQGGKDPLAAVVALEAPARDSQKYLSQFIDNGGLSREDLVERVAAAVRGSGACQTRFSPPFPATAEIEISTLMERATWSAGRSKEVCRLHGFATPRAMEGRATRQSSAAERPLL